jgi:hypothetical protein
LQPVLVHTQAFAQVIAIYNMGDEYWNSYKVAHQHFKDKINEVENEDFPLVYLKTVDPSH